MIADERLAKLSGMAIPGVTSLFRTGCRVAVVLCIGLSAVTGRTEEKKKKDGMFDFETWKAPVTREREVVKFLEPKGLDLTPAPSRSPDFRTVRLRIYADRDYRNVVFRWQAKLRAQIDRINGIVQPVFNVRFEIESVRDWDRSHVGIPFDPLLIELEALDPAREVDWVMGLVTPLHEVATSVHQIGFARLMSRHFLLRSMDDEQEIRALETYYKLLSVDERQKVYGDRKAHKEVVMFLHEWAHTMGALHNEDKTVIMNPAYDPQQSAFSEFERREITLVLERRLTRRSEPYPESADLALLLATTPSEEGSDKERAQLLAFVRQRAQTGGSTRAAARPAGTASPATDDAMPVEDVESFNRVVASSNAGHREEAWTILAPLVERAGARKTGTKTWARIAGLASAVGALTAAEDAVARAGRGDPDAGKISAEVETTRHRFALPRDGTRFGVAPAQEPRYVAEFADTARLVSSVDLSAARAHLHDLATAFPDAPGVDVLTCELGIKTRQVTAAAKRCEAALVKFKGATRAHYLLGVVAIRGRHEFVAEQHLRRAILLDPGEPAAWRALGEMYRASGAASRLAQLENEHEALLSTPLPE